jgi:hypothetical protein
MRFNGTFSTTYQIAALLAMAAAPARAVTIFNVTTNTTVFQDNFETGAFAALPGTWNFVGPAVIVSNAPNPGPAQGNFYAELFRGSDQSGQGDLQGRLSTAQATLGDVIRLSTMVFLPSASDVNARAQLFLDNGDFNSARAWARPDGHGHVDAVAAGFTLVDTGLLYSTDTWQEWDLQYVIGASTFSVAVNGAAASGFSSVSSGQVAFANFENGASNPVGSFYLDAVPQASSGVPEPGTFALLIAGFAALLAYSTRPRTCHAVTTPAPK